MILFNLRKIRDKIDFVRFDPFRALDQFPPNEEYGEEEDL